MFTVGEDIECAGIFVLRCTINNLRFDDLIYNSQDIDLVGILAHHKTCSIVTFLPATNFIV